MAWVERDLSDHLVPALAMGRDTLWKCSHNYIHDTVGNGTEATTSADVKSAKGK